MMNQNDYVLTEDEMRRMLTKYSIDDVDVVTQNHIYVSFVEEEVTGLTARHFMTVDELRRFIGIIFISCHDSAPAKRYRDETGRYPREDFDEMFHLDEYVNLVKLRQHVPVFLEVYGLHSVRCICMAQAIQPVYLYDPDRRVWDASMVE